MRWVYRAFTLTVALSILAVLVLALVPGKKLADVAVARIEAVSGREVTLSGDVTTKIFPRLSIKTGPITISNASWSDAAPMLTAEGFEFGVDVLPLLRGEFVFRDVKVLAPTIRLEVAKDGRKNWEFTAIQPVDGDGSTAEARNVTVDVAQVDGGMFQYVNRQTGGQAQFEKVDVKAKFPDFNGQVDVRASGFYEGVLFEVESVVERPLDLLTDQISLVQARGKLDGLRYDFDGKLGLSGPVMEGDLAVSVAKGNALFKTLNLGAYPFPGDVSFSGNITRTGQGAIYVRGGKLAFGDQHLSGDLDVTLGKDRPLVKGVLRAQDVNLKPLLAKTLPSNRTPQKGWSKETIDSNGLFLVDAEVALEAASVDTGGMRFGESRVLLTLENGRAVFDFRKLQTYGGNITGEFVANGRGGLSVGGDVRATNVRTGSLLEALVGYEQLESQADVALKFLGVGNSMDAIINSLSGSGTIDVQEGVLNGIDLEEMVKRLDLSYRGVGQETVFNAITARFAIDKGVLSNSDLAIKTKYLEASGRGTVGLGARNLAYRLVPTSLPQDNGVGVVKIPLLITGPWAKPKFSLDLDAVIDQELREEKAELKEKVDAARETAKLDAAKKLGVTQQEGESLEDAARRTIEENAVKELGKLLGLGN